MDEGFLYARALGRRQGMGEPMVRRIMADLLRCGRGATVVEYAVLTAVLGLVLVGLLGTLAQQVWSYVNAHLELLP